MISVVKPDKSRYVYLYLPSKADKDRWEKLAAQAQTPLSKFIIEIVESTLAEEEFRPRRELTRELDEMRKEIKALRDDVRQKSIVIERYESELKRLRSEFFVDISFEGSRKYSKELIEILKNKGSIDSSKLLEYLDIDPMDSDLAKTVSYQLEAFESYGLIETTPKGWRWRG
ncbi:MAG: hypothetical protein WBL87_03400 [Methanothrix sp.]